MEETGCEIICGAPMTLMVKGYVTMMMNGYAWQPDCHAGAGVCSVIDSQTTARLEKD